MAEIKMHMPVTRYELAGFAVIGLSEIERLFRLKAGIKKAHRIKTKPGIKSKTRPFLQLVLGADPNDPAKNANAIAINPEPKRIMLAHDFFIGIGRRAKNVLSP